MNILYSIFLPALICLSKNCRLTYTGRVWRLFWMTCRQRREACVWSLRYVGWILLHCGEAKCFSLTSCRRWLPSPVITRSSSVALQTWLIRISTLYWKPFSLQLLQSVSVVRGERKKWMQVYCLSNFDIFFILLSFMFLWCNHAGPGHIKILNVLQVDLLCKRL